MDSDRLPLRKRKDVRHGAIRAVPLGQSVEQPCIFTQGTVGSGLFNKTGGGPPEKEVGGPVRVYSLW